MYRKLQYNKLDQLGLVVWQPRLDNKTIIIPEHIRINARCLVLLFSQQEDPKILQGMLSVLDLPNHQIMRARITANNPDLAQIHSTLQEWQPEFILQLNMEQPAISGQNCVRTFSPAYLALNPQYKSQAYKTLLSLRAMLHGTKLNS